MENKDIKSNKILIFFISIIFLFSCTSKRIFVGVEKSKIDYVKSLERKSNYEKKLALLDGTKIAVKGIEQIYPNEIHFLMDDGLIGKYSIKLIDYYQLERVFKVNRKFAAGFGALILSTIVKNSDSISIFDLSSTQIGNIFFIAGLSTLFINKEPKYYKIYFLEAGSDVYVIEK